MTTYTDAQFFSEITFLNLILTVNTTSRGDKHLRSNI